MAGITSLWNNLREYGRLVRLSHTIFGLPFTLAAAAIAHQSSVNAGEAGLTPLKTLWILLAFTGARTAAMGFNRIVDRKIDAANPRTASRELPAGKISLAAASLFTVLAVAVFLGSAAALGRLPLLLSPIALAVILGYSLFKRFSWSAHLILGVALALGPAGAWVAIKGNFDPWQAPVFLSLAVATWVAGFDVIYSLQDEDFDRKNRLHSIPVKFGRLGALILSAALHLATIAALVLFHLQVELGWAHMIGIAAVGTILAYEHWIVRPNDLSRINRAFFDLNGYVSLAYLATTLLDVFFA